MMRLALTLLTCWSLAHAAESQDPPEAQGIPCWCLQGIFRIETQSYWDDQGRFHYVDKRDGAAGEVGPGQVRRGTFVLVARPGESFARLRTDHRFAIAITCRILQMLYKRCGNWDLSVARYNAGASASPSAGSRYLMLVKLAAGIAP